MPRGNMVGRWPPTGRPIAACRIFTIAQTINDQSRALTIPKWRARRPGCGPAHCWGPLSDPPPNNPTWSDGHHIRPWQDRPRWRRLDEPGQRLPVFPTPAPRMWGRRRDEQFRRVSPFTMSENVGGITSTVGPRCAPLPLSRDPTMSKPATDLLSALPSGLLSGLFAKARPTTLTADQVLFISGDEGDGCYRVDDGLLKVSVVAPTGGERILAVLGPGAMVGELSMISGAPRSASVAALRDSKLSFVSRATFDAFARDNPELYKHVMQLLANRLIDTNNALAATTFLSLQGRVARALLSLASGFGQDVGSGRIL